MRIIEAIRSMNQHIEVLRQTDTQNFIMYFAKEFWIIFAINFIDNRGLTFYYMPVSYTHLTLPTTPYV